MRVWKVSIFVLVSLLVSLVPVAAQEAKTCAEGFRVFVDVRGEVCVPQTPKRIVATHDVNAGVQVLSLGGPLVGLASRGGEFSPDITQYFDVSGIEDIGGYYEPNIERVLALKPDLIVHEGYSGTLYFNGDGTLEALEAIAPVVAIDAFRPVEAVMADYQELLGDSATVQLDDQQAEFEGVIEDIRAVLGDRWKNVTASLLMGSETGLAAWGPTALVPNDIMSRVGVSWVAPQVEAGKEENGGYLGDFSYEETNLFSADLVLVYAVEGTEELYDTPLVQALPAVKAGQVVLLDEPYFGNHYPNYISVAKNILADLQAIENFDTDIVAETEAPATESAAYPVTVTDGAGRELTVNEKPETVVCIYVQCVSALAFIGVKPDATLASSIDSGAHYYADGMQDVEIIDWQGDAPDFEQVVALKPDLVLGDEPEYTALNEFVPFYTQQYYDISTWDVFVRDVQNLAKIFGVEAETAAKLEQLAARAEAYGKASGRTKSIMVTFSPDGGDTWWVNGDMIGCGIVKLVGQCSWESTDDWFSVSLEGLLQINPDVLIIEQYAPEDEQLLATLAENPLWQELNAFKNDQIHLLSFIYARPDTPLALQLWLDQVMPLAYPDVFPAPLTDEQVTEILAA